MDFNTQRKTVKALEEKGRNPLLFIPCLIAKYAVIAFMTVCRSIDMALSDKNGNFLGIKPREKRRKSYEKEMAALASYSEMNESPEPAPERGPVKGRALWKRTVSTVLAAAFAFMTVPEIGVYAAEPAPIPLTVASMETITYSVFDGIDKSNIYELDLSSNYNAASPYPLNISANVFRDMSRLTTVTLEYNEFMTIGAGNFTNIAPDASVFVRADTQEDFDTASNMIHTASGNASLNVVWDKGGAFYSDIPLEPTAFTAYSGVNRVILQWNDSGYCDGYSIYQLNGTEYKFLSDASSSSVSGVSGGSRSHTITGTSSETTYAVRPYLNVTKTVDDNTITYKLYSKKFVSSSAKALTPGTPQLTAAASNQSVKLTVTMPNTVSDPSYYIIFSRNAQNYEKLVKFYPENFDPLTNSYEYTDPNPYSGDSTRSYIVIAYYDIFGRNTETFSDTDETSPEYTTTRSQRADISESVLTPPSNVIVTLSQDKTYWSMTWTAPANMGSLTPTYVVYANGVEIQRVNVPTARIPVSSVINDSRIDTGSDIVFSVAAQYSGMTPSAAVPAEPIKVSSQRVTIKKVTAGNSCAQITFTPFAGTNRYTLYFTHDVNGTSRTDSVMFSVSDKDCVSNADGTLTYTLSGLQNNTEYTFFIKSDAASCDFDSMQISVTPSDAPQPPMSVNVTAMEKSAEISWDIVYTDLAKTNPVDGYYVTVRKKSGETVLNNEPVPGNNSYTVQDLENDVPYYAFVSSYVVIGNDPPIVSVTSTRSAEFTPTIKVDTVTGLSVVPSDRSIKVSWATVKGATKYLLTRVSEDGSSITLDMLTKTSYEDKDIRNNVLYTYSVVAVREENGKSYESPISSPQSARLNIRLDPVTGLTSTGVDGGVSLKWDKTAGADGYYIQYYSPEDGKWHTITTVSASNTEFTYTGLSKGETYEYRVIPYAVLNGERIPKDTEISGDYTAQKTVGTAGENLPAPTDFTVTAGEGLVNLKWTAVKDADGYEIYVVGPDGSLHLLDDVSKESAIHTNIANGTTITYRVRAYKYINGVKVPGDYSIPKTVTVGVLINAPTDVVAKSGDGQVDLSWKAVDGADGYVVYCYNSAGYTFTPVGIVTSASFKHTGLTNGRNYTYMIAAYKNINGEIIYSGYSLSVTCAPQGDSKNTGSNNSAEPSDYRIYITGTTPYGMSNSNFISAFAEKGAFDSDVDVRFTLSPDTVTQVQDVLNFYGEGIDSFIYYPMDIALYKAGTDTKISINPGYYLTLTIPVPDELLPYSEDISVVHVSDLSQLEILPSVHADVNGVDCIQFTATSFSPYAFVVYMPVIMEDTSSGTPAAASGSMQYQTTASPVFMCTYLPHIYRRRMRNKVFRKV